MSEILVITQARLSSKRLPEKVLLPINSNHNSITLLNKRLSFCNEPFKHFWNVKLIGYTADFH